MNNVTPINPVHGPPRPPPAPDPQVLQAYQQSLLQLLKTKTPQLRYRARKWAQKLKGPDDYAIHKWNWATCITTIRGETLQVSFLLRDQQILSLVWADDQEKTPLMVDHNCRVIG